MLPSGPLVPFKRHPARLRMLWTHMIPISQLLRNKKMCVIWYEKRRKSTHFQKDGFWYLSFPEASRLQLPSKTWTLQLPIHKELIQSTNVHKHSSSLWGQLVLPSSSFLRLPGCPVPNMNYKSILPTLIKDVLYVWPLKSQMLVESFFSLSRWRAKCFYTFN